MSNETNTAAEDFSSDRPATIKTRQGLNPANRTVAESTAVITDLHTIPAVAYTVPAGRQSQVGGVTNIIITVTDDAGLAVMAQSFPPAYLPVALSSLTSWGTPMDVDPAIEQLVPIGVPSRIILALGDIKADYATYLQSSKLGEYLTTAGATVEYLSTENTLAGTLISLSPARRETSAKILLAAATATLPSRAPKAIGTAYKSVNGQDVNWVEGLIQTRGQNPRTLVEAAMKINTTYRTIDSFAVKPIDTDAGNGPKKVQQMKASITHDIEIMFHHPETGQIVEELICDVDDALLTKTREVLNKATHGTSIWLNTDQGVSGQIENAIRTNLANETRRVTQDSHSGWTELEDGTIGYLHSNGIATARGRQLNTRAKLARHYTLDIMDTSKISLAQELEAACAVYTASEEMTDRLIWGATVGPIMRSFAGFTPASVVPMVEGPHGSGKTVYCSGLNGLLSIDWGLSGKRRHKVDASSPAARHFGKTLEDAFIVVDDARKMQNPAEAMAMSDTVETLLRAGFEGGAARKAVSAKDELGNWGPAEEELSSPLIIMAAEKIIIPDSSASSLERLFTIPFSKKSFRTDTEVFENSMRGDRPQVHTASYIRWVAGEIEGKGSLEAWKEHGRDIWTAAKNVVLDKGLGLSPRTAGTIAGPQIGIGLWGEYLIDLVERATLEGVVVDVSKTRFKPLPSVEGIKNMIAEYGAAIETGGFNHAENRLKLGSGNQWDGILEKLTSAVAAGRAQLYFHNVSRWELRAGSSFINLGKFVNSKAWGLYVALIPQEALRILHASTEFKTMTESDLFDIFKEVRVTDGDGKKFKTVSFGNGLRVKTLGIPGINWLGGEEKVLEKLKTTIEDAEKINEPKLDPLTGKVIPGDNDF